MIMINMGSNKTPIEWDIDKYPHVMLIAQNPQLAQALAQNLVRTIEDMNVVLFNESMLENQEETLAYLADDEEPIDTLLVVSHPDMSDGRVEEFFAKVYEVESGVHVASILPDVIDVFTENSECRIII